MNTHEILMKMPDAADYPKTIETQQILADIANRHVEAISAEAAALPPDNKLQKKALMIAKNMAQLCHTFTGYTFGAKTVNDYVAKRMKLVRDNRCTDGIEDRLAVLAPDELGMFSVFAHATWLLHNAFFDKHTAEIHEAYQNGHPERAFEANIIIRVLNAVCLEWHEWWRANGSVPFEKWTYDTHPADSYTAETEA